MKKYIRYFYCLALISSYVLVFLNTPWGGSTAALLFLAIGERIPGSWRSWRSLRSWRSWCSWLAAKAVCLFLLFAWLPFLCSLFPTCVRQTNPPKITTKHQILVHLGIENTPEIIFLLIWGYFGDHFASKKRSEIRASTK